MARNRNKLITLFIGNLSNALVHQILEKATDDAELAHKYDKELLTSLDIAKAYREKINPKTEPLPLQDRTYIKSKVMKQVTAELSLRIAKGYQHIDLSLVEGHIDTLLKELTIV